MGRASQASIPKVAPYRHCETGWGGGCGAASFAGCGNSSLLSDSGRADGSPSWGTAASARCARGARIVASEAPSRGAELDGLPSVDARLSSAATRDVSTNFGEEHDGRHPPNAGGRCADAGSGGGASHGARGGSDAGDRRGGRGRVRRQAGTK